MNSIPRRAILGAGTALLAAPAFAQNAWPERPIRLLVPFPAGSQTDTLMRRLAEPMSRELGQPVVVDNRPGANGVIGTEAAARAPADGYSWVSFGASNSALATYLVRRLPYDPIRDFTPIGFIADSVFLLVVAANSEARDLTALLEMARRAPGRITYSHGNTSSLVAAATVARLAGVQVTGVPYRGGPEALTDVMAGRIDFTFTDFASAAPLLGDGKIRALAVTSARPSPLAPQIPTVRSTLADFDFDVLWFALFAPTGVPEPIVARANAALNKVLGEPELRNHLTRLGYIPRSATPAEVKAWQPGAIAALVNLARAAGVEQQ